MKWNLDYFVVVNGNKTHNTFCMLVEDKWWDIINPIYKMVKFSLLPKRKYKIFSWPGTHMLTDLPSFANLYFVSKAFEVFNVTSTAVDTTPIWFTYVHKVRPQSTYWIFGNVCQRLANSCTKKECSQSLVNSSNVAISHKWIRVQTVVIYRKGLSYDYLE